MNKVRIVSAVTSTAGITLYTDTAKAIELPATGWRTKEIMNEITKPLAERKKVIIDLDAYSIESRITQQSGGVLQFFRKKISDFASWFSSEDPGRNGDENGETVVVSVNGVEIPGIERMEAQIEHAGRSGNVKGLQKFLERVAAVSKDREHSVQELLRFLEKGDLPIADDGSIVAYKMLWAQDGKFVDPHTRKVRQWVGAVVSMNEKLVDRNRREQCSVGLHVGRRAYMPSFNGDTIMLIKIAPEDVIAVPHNETDKMRVCAYHIVAKIPQNGYQFIRSNKPMTSDKECATLLADVIAGNHVGVTDRVVIGAASGEKVSSTKIAEKQKVESAGKQAEAIDDVKTTIQTTVKEVKAVVAEVIAEKKAKAAAKKVAAAAPVQEKKKKITAAQWKAVPEQYRAAIADVSEGRESQRSAEKKYGISAKKIRRIMREAGLI